MIWYRHEFFFQPLNSPCIFFLGVCACKIFFSPSNVLHEIFFGVWMVKVLHEIFFGVWMVMVKVKDL